MKFFEDTIALLKRISLYEEGFHQDFTELE
jgi:hypothetical protein